METKRMNFRDRWENDEDGERFLFTVELQRRLSQAGLPVEPDYIDQLEGAHPIPAPPPREVETSREVETRRESREPEKKSEEEVPEPSSIQIDPLTGKYLGRVKWYNARKGYGFILRGAGEEIFFHRSNTVGDAESLDEGQWILYDVEETNKGPEATDIEPYQGDAVE